MNQKKKAYLENEYCEYWIEKGIIHERFKPSLKKISLPEAKVIVADRLKVSNEITRPIYIELGSAVSMDRKANKYFSTGDGVLYLSAIAILVKDQLEKLGVNIYMTIYPPLVPTKAFKDKKEALKWLDKYKRIDD